MGHRKRVLMLLGYYSHKMHLGIARYAKEGGWVLNASMAVTGRIPANWECDGIVCFGSGERRISTVIQHHGKPVVDLSSFAPGIDCPFIYSNQDSIGRMGADHFLSRGFQFFGYVGHSGSQAPSRYDGFKKRVEEAGKHFFHIPMNAIGMSLPSLPKPLGVMVNNDSMAIPVMDEILSLGYSIPHDVALLGVDDDELQNSLAVVPLSSIDTNAELRGYEAARLLDSLMDGCPPPEGPVVVPPRGVVTRTSTDVMAVGDADVLAALKIIREQYADSGLELSDLASKVGVCRYHLDNKFKTHIGHTIHEELARTRLEEATRLLRDTDHFAKTVARLCGFSSADHMSVAIHRRHGARTREYRKRIRA